MIRFHPATEEEEVAYVSLFSYFSSRGRFGVVANNSRSIKDIYLVPLSAKELIPSILQPLEGPGVVLLPVLLIIYIFLHYLARANAYINTSTVTGSTVTDYIQAAIFHQIKNFFFFVF